MVRIPRTPVMVLLAVGALVLTGCSRSEGGTAVTGAGAAGSAVVTSGVRPLPDSGNPATSQDAPTGGVGTPSSESAVPSSNSEVPVPVPTSTAPTTTRTTLPRTTLPPTTRPTTGATTSPGTTPGTTPPQTVPPSTAPPTPATSPGPPTAAGFPVCPSVRVTDIPAVVACLKTSVSTFWSGRLNQVVDQDVVVDPTASQVPVDCRGGLTAAPAFTCRINDTVYINQSFLDQVIHDFGTSEIPYALASVVSHEIGHVVQAAVKQPGYDRTGTSNAISQQIEQQADCLSGVWAHSQIGRLDTRVFQTVARQLITDVSSNPEIATHGTPDQRAAAIAQGLSTGTPQGCKLSTFS